MDKKRYIRPATERVVTAFSLCKPALTSASVFKGHIDPSTKIDNITVREEDQTKNMNIWDNKSEWGDD